MGRRFYSREAVGEVLGGYFQAARRVGAEVVEGNLNDFLPEGLFCAWVLCQSLGCLLVPVESGEYTHIFEHHLPKPNLALLGTGNSEYPRFPSASKSSSDPSSSYGSDPRPV